MQVHHNIDSLPPFKRAVVTTGTFDGVHLGHRQILEQVKAEARASGGETVIITFHPHPRTVIRPGPDAISLLNTLEEKTGLLRSQGIDHLVVTPFTESFASLEAKDYIAEFLVARFHPHTIVLGHDHHFGRNRSGNFSLLKAYQEEFGYSLKEIPPQLLHDSAISSTRIRKALSDGDIGRASELLGYDYFFSGTIVKGNQLGRTLGYPTANLQMETGKLVPADGVYAVHAQLNDEPAQMKGMMNIGYRPTVDGKKKVTEVNLFGFDREVYGEKLRITLKSFIRSEQKFDGLDALKAQLALDKIHALQALD